MAKRKRASNDLQNIKQKTKDRVIRTPLTTGVTSGTLEGKTFLAPHTSTCTVLEEMCFSHISPCSTDPLYEYIMIYSYRGFVLQGYIALLPLLLFIYILDS
jgi:hypothetical protein